MHSGAANPFSLSPFSKPKPNLNLETKILNQRSISVNFWRIGFQNCQKSIDLNLELGMSSRL